MGDLEAEVPSREPSSSGAILASLICGEMQYGLEQQHSERMCQEQGTKKIFFGSVSTKEEGGGVEVTCFLLEEPHLPVCPYVCSVNSVKTTH